MTVDCSLLVHCCFEYAIHFLSLLVVVCGWSVVLPGNDLYCSSMRRFSLSLLPIVRHDLVVALLCSVIYRSHVSVHVRPTMFDLVPNVQLLPLPSCALRCIAHRIAWFSLRWHGASPSLDSWSLFVLRVSVRCVCVYRSLLTFCCQRRAR